MSVTSGFFDSKNKDRLYNTEQLSSIFDGIIKDGVYMGYEDAFIVKATDPASLTVNVGPGRAWFHHTWTHNDAPLPIVVKQGDVVLDRIDSIIIDIDKTEDVRSNKVTYLEGSPSSEPTAPVLVNEEKHWQIPLCNISMPAGSTTITQAQITNRIGTSDCPFVTGIIETIDTDELLAQWNAEYREWYARVQAETEQWTEQEQEDFTNWMNGRKTEFDEWFAGIQDILDGDTAGNLLNRINHRTGINATATYSAGVVAITAPDDAGEILTFVAPSDFLSSDTYTLNGEALTITDLNGEALDDSWKKDSPITITVSGGKAFFKAGGSGKNDTLPPLLGNMTVEVVEGEETDTYTIKMDKLILDKTTEMVGGAQLEWGEEMPAKPGKGTGGIKIWTRDEVITTGKPYDGLYLGDVTPSDAITETLIYLPENDSGSVKLVPFLVLSVDYLGGVYVMRQKGNKDWVGKYGNNVTYENSEADVWTKSYLNSILDKGIVEKLLECEIHVFEQGTIKRKCWIPSYGELYSDFTDSGNTFMPYFNSNGRRVLIKQDDGNLLAYWTRTFYNLSSVRIVNPDGSGYFQSASNKTAAYRPAFVLPKDFKIQQRPDGSYTVWNEQGLMKLGDIEASTESSATILNGAEDLKAGGQSITSFIYAQKRYSENDGALLVREKVYFQTPTSTSYPDSDVSKQAVNYTTASASSMSYPKVLSSSLQKLVKEATFKWRAGNGNQFTMKAKGFVLSASDLSEQYSGWNMGTVIPYFKSSGNRIVREEINNAISVWWTRDANDSTSNCFATATDGNVTTAYSKNSAYVRQCFILDYKTPIRQIADGTYDLVPEDPALAQGISTMAETGKAVSYISLKDVPETPSVSTQKVIVKVQVENELTNFIAIKKDYGNGGYALLLEQPTEQLAHGHPSYTQGSLSTWYTGVFKAKLPSEVQKHLVEATVMSRDGNAEYSIFIPSATELGAMGIEIGNAGTNDGVRFTGFVPNNPADRITSPAVSYATRTDAVVNMDIYCVNSQGSFERLPSTTPSFLRPMILLSGDALVTDNGDGTYTFVGDEPDNVPQVTHTVEVPHGQKMVFRQFTQNQKKQFQTMLVGGVYPPLGEVEPPFALPEFTGNCAIFGDETAGRIELYESGDLTLYPGLYDIFLVGGGASGSITTDTSGQEHTGGGGGGYTTTISDIVVSERSEFIATVGAGGNRSAGSQTIFENGSTTIKYTANGGAMVTGGYTANGGAGGSGGGGFNRDSGNGYAGGSDGSNGLGRTGGMGQGTTTRMFGEAGNTLFSGGGGGAGDGRGYYPGAGGAGGGGAAGNNVNGVAGTANTGGGGGGYSTVNTGALLQPGAGGSGIIIIRWNNAAQ